MECIIPIDLGNQRSNGFMAFDITGNRSFASTKGTYPTFHLEASTTVEQDPEGRIFIHHALNVLIGIF
jgi:hypothetical protein